MPSTWETQFGLNPSSAADAAADPDGDGATNLAEFQRGSHPKGFHARFLAEGASNAFFQTQVGIANPGTTAATVVTRFLGDNGRTWSGGFSIPARQSRSVSANGLFASSFSTVIESDQPLVADRVMTWGGGYGSHSETATAAPSPTWFLAEGATHGNFQLFYLLQNPAATAAHVEVTYLRPTPAAPITVSYTVAAESRLTIAVDAVAGLAATDVSARIVSDVPILVERAMYMDTANPGQVFGAGHAGSGGDRREPALVPGGRRDGRVLRHVLPGRQPLDPGDARARHLPPAERRADREGIRRSPPRAGSRSRSTSRMRGWPIRRCRRSSNRSTGSASSSSDRCGGRARAAGMRATCRPDRR